MTADTPDPIAPERVTLTEGERITRDRMAHYGYTPEQIADAEDTGPHVAACDFSGLQWECEDEHGRSNHPVRDELEQTAEFVMWVLEHPALSDRLREAKADAWDRCHDDLCGNKDWAGACIYPVHANPYRETP